ncbi:MAG: hypothetical protein ACFFDT_06345, partial [Candidatus Hodarchaeota archaeon]
MAEKNSFSQKFDVRKIQKTGGSSYVITLPKSWLNSLVDTEQVKDNGEDLNNKEDKIKGMKLGLVTQPNNTLLITPNLSGKPIQR